jgi:site-specific recombinase XerD
VTGRHTRELIEVAVQLLHHVRSKRDALSAGVDELEHRAVVGDFLALSPLSATFKRFLRTRPVRHTYATYLRSQGVRWEAVEYMMGHRLRDTTGRYVHLLAEDREAVEAALTAAFGGIVDMWLEPANVARR